MKVKERGYAVTVYCTVCKEEHTLLVNIDDWFMFGMPNRPHIQDIFPYLTPAEREMLITGICPKCWQKLFPPEPEFPEDFEEVAQ